MRIEAFILYSALILWIVIYPLRTKESNLESKDVKYHSRSLFIMEHLETGKFKVDVWINRPMDHPDDTPFYKVRSSRSLEEVIQFLEIDSVVTSGIEEGFRLVNEP